MLVRDIVEKSGLSINPWTLFFASYGINLLLSVLTVVGYAALARVRHLEFSATGTPPEGFDHDDLGSAGVSTSHDPRGTAIVGGAREAPAPDCSPDRRAPASSWTRCPLR